MLSSLSKSYGEVRAVQSIDLTIYPGEPVALLGPNGAGMTTTIDMLLGLTRPDSGYVSLFGLPPDETVAAGQVGAMLQTGSLVPYLSVREVVTMVASIYPRPLQVEDALERSGTLGFADRWRASSPVVRLNGSGSPWRWSPIRICWFSTSRPRLWTSGRRDFWASIRGVTAMGKTVIFATKAGARNRAEAVRVADERGWL